MYFKESTWPEEETSKKQKKKRKNRKKPEQKEEDWGEQFCLNKSRLAPGAHGLRPYCHI